MRQYVSPTTILANEEMTYYLMDENEVLQEMTKAIKEVNEILGLPSTTMVRLLLNHFHWDKDTLTDRYWEDPDKLFRVLNLVNPNSTSLNDFNPVSPLTNTEENQKLMTCRTCCAEKPPNEFYSLPCNHLHCLACWQLYLESNLMSYGNRTKISCPSRCNQIIDDEQIFDLLKTNDRLKNFYQQILINSYVNTNRLTQWCPGNRCSTVVKLKSYVTNCTQMISCDKCQTIFCFHCLKQWHDPIQCSLLVKWEKKNHDESMTGEWIVANTKDCPKCHSNIEKNGGCNHMTCRKPGCGHEFCWLCFGSWKDHASRQCNVFQPDETNQNKIAARESLARYMHYFTRYQVHNQSLELEGQLLEKVEQRIHEMQTEAMSFTDQQAIYKAFHVLKECRRTLKYTYAFGYYLYRNNQAEVFEQNQADLERATEALSGFLEQEFDPEETVPYKIMDKISYCDQRRKTLISHCKEGYAEHYWAGLDPY